MYQVAIVLANAKFLKDDLVKLRRQRRYGVVGSGHLIHFTDIGNDYWATL